MKIKLLFLTIIACLILSGCTPSNNDPTYIIQKQSVFDPSRWDDVIDVYGFSDDYTTAQDIVNFLDNDGGKYRVITK